MELKQIEIFIKVAGCKSFSRAASEMFLTQPAVSAQIASLENELGVQLLNRNSRKVTLTPAGERFLPHALDMVDTFYKAVSSLTGNDKNITGRLNLMASTVPCNSILPPLIKKFSESYPEISFDVMELNTGKIIDNILKFNCEIGFTGSSVNDTRIKSYKLVDDELVLISHPGFRVPEKLRAQQLFKYRFILREKGSATRRTFEQALESHGVNIESLNVCCQVNSLDAVFKFVTCGIGISVVSRSVCEQWGASIRISAIEDLPLKRNLFLVVRQKRSLTPPAKVFFDFCRHYFGFNNP